ncbi:MAG TPA: Wzz/FepE/Etk N-terminal domain-containing protein [Lacipirellulaceae bacterium]|nr:Wzz/FepE/Etk N-terminal domain-containing protein [Lacipirellulaceae bacterium]
MHRHANEFPQATPNGALNPIDFIRILRTHVRWWLVPAVVCAVIAAAYSLVAPRTWQASQALIIRPEAASVSDEKLGKFSDLSEMKTLQETILELAKSQGVVQAALREVGPPRGYRRPERWPASLDVEAFRDCVDMRPPGGAEFGKTEVFYLSVRQSNRDRAAALVAALCCQLEHRMQEIRDQRAQGMVAELERTVAMADGDLAGQTSLLSAFEAGIGADLAELRTLNADAGAQSASSQELQAIESERRSNESQRRENERLLKLLSSAQGNTQQLLATPNSLLQSQPAVSQLKTALVKAQVHTAALLGSRSEKHPFVVAARQAEELLRRQLHDEVAVSIRGLEVDVELGAEREDALSAKSTAIRERISRLAHARAEYATLLASVANHTRLVEAARKNLADARAQRAGALSASVISRIDGVEAGVHPVGPSRKTVTAGGGIAGLLLGVGLVFLFAHPVSIPAAAISQPPIQSDAGVGSAPSQSNGVSQMHSVTNGHASHTVEQKGGLFHGMTLEQAIRSVAHRG